MAEIVFVPTGRRLSAIVRRQSNVGGPLVYLPLHSSFARLTPELRLARQLRLHGRNRICSHRAKAVRHSSASVERRRTSCLPSTSFFLRPADAGATAGTPAKAAWPKSYLFPPGEGCPP